MILKKHLEIKAHFKNENLGCHRGALNHRPISTFSFAGPHQRTRRTRFAQRPLGLLPEVTAVTMKRMAMILTIQALAFKSRRPFAQALSFLKQCRRPEESERWRARGSGLIGLRAVGFEIFHVG